MPDNPTYYDILGVDPTASPAEISQQYSVLHEVYPQGQRLRELEEAYRVLRYGWSREDYDNKLIEQGLYPKFDIVNSATPVDELFDMEEAETEGVSASSLAELMEETSIDNGSFDVVDSDDYDQLYEGEIEMEDVVALMPDTSKRELDVRSPSEIRQEIKTQAWYDHRLFPQKSHNDDSLTENQNLILMGICILAVGLSAIMIVFGILADLSYTPVSTSSTRIPPTPILTTDELIQLGINDYMDGNYYLAVSRFSLAIADMPSAQLYFLRGQAMQAILMNPSTAQTYDTAILTLALNDFERTLELDSEYYDVYQERGLLFYNLCKLNIDTFCRRAYADLTDYSTYIEAIEPDVERALQELISLVGENITLPATPVLTSTPFRFDLRGYDVTVDNYMQSGLYNVAVNYLTQIIQDAPTADTYFRRAQAYHAWYTDLYLNSANSPSAFERFLDDGIDDYTQAIALDPAFAEAYQGRGIAYYVRWLQDSDPTDGHNSLFDLNHYIFLTGRTNADIEEILEQLESFETSSENPTRTPTPSGS